MSYAHCDAGHFAEIWGIAIILVARAQSPPYPQKKGPIGLGIIVKSDAHGYSFSWTPDGEDQKSTGRSE